jgi:hypothetical protein
MKRHGGSGRPQGQLNRGPRTLPAGGPYHAGSGMPKGRVHSPQGSPSSLTSLGPHGGTSAPRSLNRRK